MPILILVIMNHQGHVFTRTFVIYYSNNVDHKSLNNFRGTNLLLLLLLLLLLFTDSRARFYMLTAQTVRNRHKIFYSRFVYV